MKSTNGEERSPLQILLSVGIFAALLMLSGLGPLRWESGHLYDLTWTWVGAPDRWARMLLAWAWIPGIVAGFWGWTYWLRKSFLRASGGFAAPHLAWASALGLYPLWLYGWGVQGLLNAWTAVLFFVPGWWALWRHEEARPSFASLEKYLPEGRAARWGLAFGAGLWVADASTEPLFWDALVDHFQFAREAARTGFLPLGWPLFNGTGPKSADLMLSGFICLGGERLAHLMMLLPAFSCVLLLGDWAERLGGGRRWVGLLMVGTPFLLPLFTWGFVEGFLGYFLAAAAAGLLWESEGENARVQLRASVFLLGVGASVKWTACFAVAGWLAVWLWRLGRPRQAPRWDPLWIPLFLAPCAPWMLRAWIGQGNPFFPLGASWFPLPPGYDAARVAAILQATVPPAPGWLGFAGNLWKNFFTSGNGMLTFPLGALLWMSLPWRTGTFAWGRTALFFTATLTAWGFQSSHLRHGVVLVLILTAVSAVAWHQAFQKTRAVRWLFVAAWCVGGWTAFASLCRTTVPFSADLGMEDNWDRVARNYYMDGETRGAYRWIERHSDPADRVLIFTSFLSYPLERAAFFDLQWENPTLLRWSAEEGSADALARRLKRQGVVFLIYERLESDFLAGGDPRFGERSMPEAEWVKFWGIWTEPEVRWENTVVYRLRATPATGKRPLVDLPGLQEKPLAEARRARSRGDLTGTESILTRFLATHPGGAYVRFVRAGVIAAQGRRVEALEELRRAGKDGLQTKALAGLAAALEVEPGHRP